jgi:hypothetical protein
MIIDKLGQRLCDPKCGCFVDIGFGFCSAKMLYHGWDKPEYIIGAQNINYCNVPKGFKLIKDNGVINV